MAENRMKKKRDGESRFKVTTKGGWRSVLKP